MTSIATPALTGGRTRRNRMLRKATSHGMVTLFAIGVCFLFILPLLYMLSASFSDNRSLSTPGAPLWPAIPRTWKCVNPADNPTFCYQARFIKDPDTGEWKPYYKDGVIQGTDATGKALFIYDVPGYGLLAELNPHEGTDMPSIFVDPNHPTKWISLKVEGQLQQVWDFGLTFDNFSNAASWTNLTVDGGFFTLFRNTFAIAIIGTIGATLSAIVVAYGFARFRIPGRDGLFLLLISTILLPFQVTLIPQFIVYAAIGWTQTWYPLLVPHYFSNAYNVFLLRQYFMTLPRELDEAAMIDGASPFRVLTSVIIPQSWPAIMAVVLFHFFWAWNDYLGPLIYLSSNRQLWPLSIGIQMMQTTYRAATGPAAIQAAALLTLIVPVLLFFLAQRVFMRGVVISGVEK
jgi:multiple sugar transport system permease protein